MLLSFVPLFVVCYVLVLFAFISLVCWCSFRGKRFVVGALLMYVLLLLFCACVLCVCSLYVMCWFLVFGDVVVWLVYVFGLVVCLFFVVGALLMYVLLLLLCASVLCVCSLYVMCWCRVFSCFFPLFGWLFFLFRGRV